MRRILLLCSVLFMGLPLAGQTYVNHPRGVTFGGPGTPATVARLTLPAGTYSVLAKFDLQSPVAQVWCNLWGTGVPNVTNPYSLDSDVIALSSQQDGSYNNLGKGVLTTSYSTAGGSLWVSCYLFSMSGASGYTATTGYISLSATKISQLIRQ
jgi:hypothetical protein